MVIYQEYEHLSYEDKLLYRDILSQLRQGREQIEVATGDRDKCVALYNKLLHDHPEFFWYDKGMRLSTVISPSGIMTRFIPSTWNGIGPQEISVRKRQVESALSAIVSRAMRYGDDYSRILYVHDFLVDNTVYIDAPDCYNAYGCLIEHRAVCAGISAAFQMILQRLDITCGRMSGTSAGTPEGARTDHEWNYCMLGDRYYHVDATWDNPDAVGMKTGKRNHHFFLLSEKEISLTHQIHDVGFYIPMCVDDSQNFYVRFGMYLGRYSFSEAAACIERQGGSGVICLKFDSREETEKAVADLIRGRKIFSILRGHRAFHEISRSGRILSLLVQG